MAVSEQEIGSDPITAALPPNSDYITYLTILEYQLTPERLPVLTNHLAKDDGTLAKEIGWDLVKLILPLLNAAPKDAAKCLEVVARRGNPREVVIRVAEALETLGADDDKTESEINQDLGTDEPPTFTGEAQRIHLGEMKLQGMPLSSTRRQNSDDLPEAGQQQDASATSDSSELQFSTLLSMLGLLHSRIKTQYPSRFLATSLPAALGAYRRIQITSETTTVFVALLGKMSGKQRPTLPPRSSTASATHMQYVQAPGTAVCAPLPDPEGHSEVNAKAPSDLEMSIVRRLLQAVLLEVLEEYLLADPNTIEWSTRLLEKQSPNKAIPDRKSRSKSWQDDESLRSKDTMMNIFLRLAKDLRLNLEAVFRGTNLPLVREQDAEDVAKDQGVGKEEDEEPSEFPTSPSHIPYSHLGALFLFLASRVPAVVYSDEKIAPFEITMPDLHHFVNQFVVPTPTLNPDLLIPSAAHNQPSAIDALLSLLLLAIPTQKPTVTTSESTADADHKSLISILSCLSAEHPDPSFRTSAHHLATTVLHNHPSSAFRLAVIRSTITDCGPFENLKEVAINWLKEEILLTFLTPKSTSSSISSGAETQQPTSSGDENNIFASLTLFSDDETLSSLLFPTTIITSQPTPSSSDEQPAPRNPTTLTLPIASLNLLFLLLTNPILKPRYQLAAKITSLQQSSPEIAKTTSSHCGSMAFESKALDFLTSLQKYVDDNAGVGSKEEEGRLGLLALAVGRVRGALEGYEREKGERGGKMGEGGWTAGVGLQEEKEW